jgi:type IV pilus assembly protein PilA
MRQARVCCCQLINCAGAVALFLLFVSSCASQRIEITQPVIPFSDDLKKYPGLLQELGHLAETLKNNVQMPPVRTQSWLLPELPAQTTYYIAFPNYGETAHQTLETLNWELQQSAILRDWWQHGELSSAGPKLQDFLAKFYEVSQYLGDEVVVSGTTERGIGEPGAADGTPLVVIQVRKPGLKDALKEILKELPDKSEFPIRVLDLQELAQVKDGPAGQQLTVLVRSDFVIASPDVEGLRRFNSFLNAKTTDFASTAFGQRLTEAYQGGTSALMAADLHTIISQLVQGKTENQKMLERTGFKDAKYLVWEYRHKASGSGNQMELSFTGTRHGIASWLATPAPFSSLEFVSPQAAIVSSVHLKNLGEIFDDIKEIASSSNPNALSNVAQMERAMHFSLRDDLLALLPGEVTVAVDSPGESKAEWETVLRISDADHLQKTLQKILAAMPVQTTQFEDNGITYHSIKFPSPQKTVQYFYAFADDYLIVASSHEMVAEGIRLHKSGESFARSKKLQESLPAGYSADVSALLYEDPATVTALNLRQLSPDMAKTFARLSPPTEPIVFRAYGEDSAIRGVSTSGGADAGIILVAAAVAIPNLMRARIAANESSAITMVRTAIVAQVSYSASYPDKGYAPDLATLGPDPRGTGFHSPEHASLIDSTLGNLSCTSGAWCSKSGYNFTLIAHCQLSSPRCKEFVVVGTPLTGSTGTRSFCATSNGVVRYKFTGPLSSSINEAECHAWIPLP